LRQLSWLARHYRIFPWGYIAFISVITMYEIWHPCQTWWGRLFYWLNIPFVGLCMYSMGKSVASIDRIKQEIDEIKAETSKLEVIAKARYRFNFNNEREP
jgi:hypothetical protein